MNFNQDFPWISTREAQRITVQLVDETLTITIPGVKTIMLDEDQMQPVRMLVADLKQSYPDILIDRLYLVACNLEIEIALSEEGLPDDYDLAKDY